MRRKGYLEPSRFALSGLLFRPSRLIQQPRRQLAAA
jgi:hypothetical protein